MLLIVLTVLLLAAYAFLQRRHTHWQRLGVPSLREHAFFGNVAPILLKREASHATITRFYARMKTLQHKHAGFYAGFVPFYVPISSGLIGEVMSKVNNRGFYCNEEVDPLSAHVFALDGWKWREARARLTPAYTPARVRQTLDAQLTCAVKLAAKIAAFDAHAAINVSELCSRYSMDLIASSAFGLDVNTLDAPAHRFRAHALLALRDYSATYRFAFCYLFNNHAKLLNLRFINKTVSDYFRGLSASSVVQRAQTRRNDLLQSLIDLHAQGAISSRQLHAECYAFFVAGFNTTSLTIAYALYEIAKDCSVQRRLKEELASVLRAHDGEITYEALAEMEYLQQVIDETTRMYPPVPVYLRECAEPFPVPNTETILPKGTRVAIPVYGIQHDPEHFPEPERFDPERFSKANRRKIAAHSYMPFGEGPRICIALKFATVQIKLGVIAFLRNNRIRLHENTPERITMAKNAQFLYPEKDIFIEII